MTKFISTLGNGARIAAMATVVGIMATGSAIGQQTPASCTNITTEWVPAFNTTYSCNGGTPAAECSILEAGESCCDNTSGNNEQKTCICGVYNSNLTVLNGLGIQHNNC